MKVLVKFRWDYARCGDVEGLFITTQKELKASYGKYVYFGEILGKHSEVDGELNKSDFKIITQDQDFIEKLINLFDGETLMGCNPLDVLAEGEE